VGKNKPFCIFDKDEKTFNHVKLYYKAIEDKVDLFKVDCQLQQQELEIHLNRCKKEHDKSEQLAWLNKNAEPLRAYINSLKMIALFMYIENKRIGKIDVTWELFCQFAEVWDEEKQIIIDTIRVESRGLELCSK
jgi:hypothetical protein